MLNSILLQIPPDAYTFLGIGALVTAAVSVIMVIVTVKQNNDTKYLEFIRNVDREISNHLEKETSLKGKDACIIYAYNYIDICDRVLFLIRNGTISKAFLEYYGDFFSYASTVMWWYVLVYPKDVHSIKNSWPSLIRWIVNENHESYPAMHLPTAMKDILPDGVSPDTSSTDLHLQLISKINHLKNPT